MTDSLPAAPKQQALMIEFGEKLGLDPVALGQTLVQTIFPNATATKEQVYALLLVAKRYNLDPLLKQIYALPARGGGIIPVVGYDGMCGLANDHPEYDGVVTYPILDDAGAQIGCRAVAYRKDRTHPTDVTEWISECSTNSGTWKKSPGRMIRNRAVTQAFRLAFSFSGIYTPDEGQQVYDAQHEINDYAAPKSKVAESLEEELAEPEPTPPIEVDEHGQVILFDDSEEHAHEPPTQTGEL